MAHPPPRVDPKQLPAPERRSVAVRLRPSAERAVREGHPWVFADGIISESRVPEAGTVAVVFDRKDRFLAAGFHDTTSGIRIRLLVHRQPEEVGPSLFRTRIVKALERREGVVSPETTGFRVLHGENDGMPGLVADLYGRSLVLKLYTASWTPHLRTIVPIFEELLAPDRILLLVSRQVARSPATPREIAHGALFSGTLPEPGIPFLESGLRFEAHPLVGHKTGFYLDQRDNRRKLEGEVSGGRVLNVFSYSGAFSLYAARGGAQEVVNIDRATPALNQSRRHFELNRDEPAIAECRLRTEEGDAFEVMERLIRAGETFEVVVVDPPSFATSGAHQERALVAYGRLTALALDLLIPGGLLVQASCSSRVRRDAFYARIHDAARGAGTHLEELERTGHPTDHPIGFPEGAYLKCLWARKSGRR